MSEALRCDNCGAHDDARAAYRWVRVERVGGIVSFGEAEGPWHFCSRECMSEWGKQVEVPSVEGETQ